MSKSISEKIFFELKRIIDFENLDQLGILRFESSGYMPLVIEKLTEDTISMTHYYKSNGDMICDPDMMVQTNSLEQKAQALSYQDSYRYQDVRDDSGIVVDHKLQNALNDFLLQWIHNLKDQGFFDPQNQSAVITTELESRD